ncbi:MAG: hypothetical protein JST40_03990 [Armatimonadetes bacterium]|nr:hypothetical protein [Armatimonadota bacterium]
MTLVFVVACLFLSLIGAGFLQWVIPRLARESEQGALDVFARAIEMRAPGWRGRTEAGVDLAITVAETLQWEDRAIHRLEQVATLRFLGLCSVPFQALNVRGRGAWTEEDHLAYANHSEQGASILARMPHLAHMAPILRSAPKSFQDAPKAPAEARLLKLVDAYLDMESEHGSLFALDHITRRAGELYDPTFSRALVAILAEDVESHLEFEHSADMD